VNGRNVGEIASLHAHKRPNLTQTLVNFAKRALPGFNFTSIQVNKNYLSAMHVSERRFMCCEGRALHLLCRAFVVSYAMLDD
jgi:hypothetical protein